MQKIMYRFFLLLSVIVGVAGLGSSPSSRALAYEYAVQPTVGSPGAVFAFFSTGFQSYEWVTFWVNAPDGRTYEGSEVRVNEFGRVDWTWKSPTDAMPGRWSMVALGHDSGVERVIFFEIRGKAGDVPQQPPAGQRQYDAAVSPPEGAPGTEFAFYATGFRSYERVVFWVNSPQGSVYEVGAFGTDEDGRVDWTWESPVQSALGEWHMVARGERSQVERVVDFRIQMDEPYPEEAAPIDTYDSAVNPREGPPGTRFFFFISNFIEGEPVKYWLKNPHGEVHLFGSTKPNRRGRVDWIWDAPEDAEPGTWEWVARGDASGDERSLQFIITGMPEAEEPYSSAVNPLYGYAGDEFAFYAEGFSLQSPVDYWFNSPNGEVCCSGSTRTDERGRADWTWKSPPDAVRGEWTTVARDRDTGFEQVIHFFVQ
jgi:hypothetical protein